jgi:DNA-binding MarR family transcriptional regulator
MSNKALSLQERDAWRGFRRMAELISGRVAQDITRATELSGSDFAVLMLLGETKEGQQRQRDLQAFLEWDKTRLSHQLSRMASRGLIEREVGDGSTVMIGMTKEGRRLLAAARPVHAQGVRKHFLDHLSQDDLSNLQAIAQKLRKALSES